MSMNPDQKKWLMVRVVVYVLLLLLAIALMLPNLVKARWSSSGVPVVLKIAVADAQTGQPVRGARTMVWLTAEERWPINEGRVGDISATTDSNGTCEVFSYFPGSGSGKRAKLNVNSMVWIRAEGYEPLQAPTATYLGEVLEVSGPVFTYTNAFSLKISLTRKVGRR